MKGYLIHLLWNLREAVYRVRHGLFPPHPVRKINGGMKTRRPR